MNFCNYHLWADENLHANNQFRHHQQLSIYVWVGIVDSVLVVLHGLPQRLTENSYRHILENDFHTLLEVLSLAIKAQIFHA
jgi:hypothetical protein